MRDQKNKKMHIAGEVQWRPVSYSDLAIEKHERASDALFAQWVRVLRQNRRQGTVGCKDRSEVAFSNKKPWKQKGTGRARAGSLRSPLWRKGGVIFGPQPRVRTLSMNQKMKKRILQSLAYDFAGQSRIISLDWALNHDRPRTAAAFQALKAVQLAGKKINMFLSFNDDLHRCSFVNIPFLRVISFDQPNAYDLANSDYWVFLNKDSALFKEMVARWN
jgi:large subunit ribosomal protein L4